MILCILQTREVDDNVTICSSSKYSAKTCFHKQSPKTHAIQSTLKFIQCRLYLDFLPVTFIRLSNHWEIDSTGPSVKCLIWSTKAERTRLNTLSVWIHGIMNHIISSMTVPGANCNYSHSTFWLDHVSFISLRLKFVLWPCRLGMLPVFIVYPELTHLKNYSY